MAIYTNLPVYKASYRLLLDVSRIMRHVSRDNRYTIGQETRRRIMDIIVMIYRANRTRQKAHVIAGMREALLEVQVCIRLLCDMRDISEGQYAALAEQTASMSKQMAAWEKSEREREHQRQSDGAQAPDYR